MTRFRRLVVTGAPTSVLGGLLLVASTQPAAACSCVRLPLEQEARTVDGVFVGTTGKGGVRGRFNSYGMTVTAVYKGRGRR